MPILGELKRHKLLLDTHVWIWVATGNSILNPDFAKSVEKARVREHLFISPISIWEISMLVERKRLLLEMDLSDWIEQWIRLPGIQTAEFTFEVAILSNRLPESLHGPIHGDPADRIIIASAYQENAVLVTADQKLLRFGENHFISVFDPTAKL